MTVEVESQSNGKPSPSERMKAYHARKRAERVEETMEAIIQAKPQPKPKPQLQQSKATEARWAGEQATERDLRAHFETLELPQAFALYQRMRKNLEIAGRILNDRANVPEVQHCKTCGISQEDYFKRGRKNDWFLNRPHFYQGDRNIIEVEHFCSAACISLENNKTQGVYGMSDQGMTPDMNPKNHPHLKAG